MELKNTFHDMQLLNRYLAPANEIYVCFKMHFYRILTFFYAVRFEKKSLHKFTTLRVKLSEWSICELQ